MRRFPIVTVFALAVVGTALATSAEPATLEAQPLQPERERLVRFMSGGVGEAEQEAIRQKADGYNLWLTLTRPDGAYLARVDVQIQDSSGQTVLDTRTRGPFLLASLKPGRYRIQASADDWHTGRRTVDVPATGQDRVYLALEER